MKNAIITAFVVAISGSALAQSFDIDEYPNPEFLRWGDDPVENVTGTNLNQPVVVGSTQPFDPWGDIFANGDIEGFYHGYDSDSALGQRPAIGSSESVNIWGEFFPDGNID